jgi:hypothetical protein
MQKDAQKLNLIFLVLKCQRTGKYSAQSGQMKDNLNTIEDLYQLLQ